MRVWLVTIGEPLPSDGPDERLLRTGILANLLVDRGHEVVWWTSSFDHTRRRQRCESTTTLASRPGLRIVLLKGASYQRSVSLNRVRNHRQVACEFRVRALEEKAPDVVVSSFPTIELCREAARYGRERQIPVLLDIRDLWPESITHMAPRALRPVARVGLRGMYSEARRACAAADGLIGLTDAVLEWGLSLAGRPVGPGDAVFPMAYCESVPDVASRRRADAAWDDRGISAAGEVPVFCFFGTLGRQFDLRTVLDAARRVEAAGQPARWVICGDGDARAALVREARGMSNVLFPGWVDRAEIWTLMQRSTAGLAPYLDQFDFRMSLANKPIEYLSAGLPVVTCIDGVLRRLVENEDCGCYYRAGDAARLAEQVTLLAESEPLRDRQSQNAKRVYESRFVAERVYGDFIDHLDAVQRAAAPRLENREGLDRQEGVRA